MRGKGSQPVITPGQTLPWAATVLPRGIQSICDGDLANRSDGRMARPRA